MIYEFVNGVPDFLEQEPLELISSYLPWDLCFHLPSDRGGILNPPIFLRCPPSLSLIQGGKWN